MNHLEKPAAAMAAAILMFSLTACGDGEAAGEAQTRQKASNGDVYNDADVDFATGMIPHHAQALAMVDMTRGRELSPDVRELTDEIRSAQGPEIEQMVDWLTAWDKPVPETMRDHANAEDHGMSGHDMGDDDKDMAGTMSDKEMDELESMKGQPFETMWLEMMIEHHEGAIDMAEDERDDGVFRPAKKLAVSIDTSQQAEIDQMKSLLDR